MLKRRSGRSEGGQIAQESIVGSCLDLENWRGGEAAREEARRARQGPPRVSAGRRWGRAPSRQAGLTRTRERPSVQT